MLPLNRPPKSGGFFFGGGGREGLRSSLGLAFVVLSLLLPGPLQVDAGDLLDLDRQHWYQQGELLVDHVADICAELP